jgi:serine/threonine-protein kinase
VRPDEYRTMNALLIDPIERPSRIAAVAPELEEIVMKALDRDPAERFQTADQLRAALDAYVVSLGALTRPELARAIRSVFPDEHTILPASEEEPSANAEIAPQVISRATIQAPATGRAPRREVVMLAAGAVVAAALGGGLGWAGKRLRGGQPAAVIATAGPSIAAGAAPSIGVEPLAPRPRPEQLAVPVPPAAPVSPAASATAETTSPAEPAPAERPRRPARKKVVGDLAAKKNPF